MHAQYIRAPPGAAPFPTLVEHDQCRLPNRAYHAGQPTGWLGRLLPYERTDYAFRLCRE